MRSISVIFVLSAFIAVTACSSKVDVGETSDSNVSGANNDNESTEEASGDDEGTDVPVQNEDSSSAEIQLLRAQRAQAEQQIENLRALREQQYEPPRGGYRLGPGGGASRAGDNAARMAIAQDIDRLNAEIEQIDMAIERHQSK